MTIAEEKQAQRTAGRAVRKALDAATRRDARIDGVLSTKGTL